VAYFGDAGGDDSASLASSDFDDFAVVIEVQPVPLPGAALLIGSAFAGAGAVRRFGRRRA
jgi:hypothetical protein